jgi:hypothetical protein
MQLGVCAAFPSIKWKWNNVMSTGFRPRAEEVSTVVGGKEFDLTNSKRISRFESPTGEVNSLYQDPSGEYFTHIFTPQTDTIARLDQDQASKLASVMNEDGTSSGGALAEIFPEEDTHEAFLGIPGDLANQLQDQADRQDLEFEDYVLECLQRLVNSELN